MKRAIFRPTALAAYRRGNEKDNVPRLIFWPAIACLWVLLGILVAAGFMAWDAQIPSYVEAAGILAPTDVGTTRAVVFLPSDQAEQVHVGQPADVAIGSMGKHLRASIAGLAPDTMSPQAIRRSYRLDGTGLLVTQPSFAVVVRLHAPLSATDYAGTIVTVRIETGSQRVLALLPGIGRLFGGQT